MANPRFTLLLKKKIKSFIDSYEELSRQLFLDPSKKTNISHTGEFGAYREALVKDFLRMFVPERLQIDSGFAINANGEVSPQLDIILYDPAVTPRIEDAEYRRFFPIECICGVGEVKSVLRSKSELGDALHRLWQVKRMALNPHPRNSKNPSAPPFTFLFCEKIEADPSGANTWFVDYYNSEKIPKDQWHNVIATIGSGIFKYSLMQEVQTTSTAIPKGGILAKPVLPGNIFNQNFHVPAKEDGGHLISFGHDLSIEFANRVGTLPDIISYTDEYK